MNIAPSITALPAIRITTPTINGTERCLEVAPRTTLLGLRREHLKPTDHLELISVNNERASD